MENGGVVGKNITRCPVCGDAIEREIDIPLLDGSGDKKKMTVHCMCRCMRLEMDGYEKRMRFEDDQRRIEELRRLSLMDARLRKTCFASYRETDENRKAFIIAKNYVENFDVMFAKGQGLLFWGNVGTGKSYTAAAIANELLKRMQPVIMTSFVKLINDMGSFENDDSSYIAKLNRAKLLIVDDLGAERGTDFSLEKVYDIIDSRYRSGKPIILTTNLELSHMKSCDDTRYSRIYDRIFEMCYPVKVDGMSWRKRGAASIFAETKKILEG